MKSLVALAFILLLTPSVPAQTCRLTEAPTIRGLKLGQPFAEAVKVVRNEAAGGLTGGRGARMVRLAAGSLPSPEFDGVSTVRLRSADGDILSGLEITYDRTATWKSDGEFADAIADSLSLPRRGWRDNPFHTLRCEGFSVTVRASRRLLTISRTGLKGEVKTR